MIIAKIKKNNTNEIQISVDDYKGKKYINVREYFKNGADFLPTKKGFNIILDKKEELINLVSELKKEDLGDNKIEFMLINNYKLQAGKSEYMSYQFFEIRKYYLDEDNQEWRPTKQGVTFRAELIDEIYNAVKSIP